MQVRDTGAGLQVRTLKALRTGVGLSNTRARLDCLYGRHYRLEFSDKHGGLSVRIEIPFQRVTAAGGPRRPLRPPGAAEAPPPPPPRGGRPPPVAPGAAQRVARGGPRPAP